MLYRRSHLFGLFAALLALMAQFGAGAGVPRIDPVAIAGVLCHSDDDAGGTPSQSPAHSPDCQLCPLCATAGAQQTLLVSDPLVLTPPVALAARRSGLPPPATAPPSPHRPPSQPRGPPTIS